MRNLNPTQRAISLTVFMLAISVWVGSSLAETPVRHPIHSHQPFVRLPFVPQPNLRDSIRQAILNFGRDTMNPAVDAVFANLLPYVSSNDITGINGNQHCIETTDHSFADHAIADLLLGRLDAARAEANSSLGENDNSLHGHLARGWLAFVDARYGEAATEFSSAIENNKKCPAPYVGIAFVRIAMTDDVGALSAFKIVNSLEPNYWDALTLKGLLLRRTGHNADGVADIEAAFAHAPDDVFARQTFANTRSLKYGIQGEIDAYSELIAIYPTSAEALTLRCSLYVDAGRPREALADCNRAWQLERRVHGLNESIGLALRNLGNDYGAITAFNNEVALYPKEAVAYRDRGVTFRHLHEFDRAIADLTTAIQLAPDYTDALVDRSAAYCDLRKFELCIADANAALAISPDYPQAFLNRGNAEFWLGRYQSALSDFDQALVFRPDFSHALVSKGDTERALGRFDDAIADYSRALSREPTNAAAVSGKEQAEHKVGSVLGGANSPSP